MKKVLILSQIQSNGGIENHIANLCQELATSEFSFTLGANYIKPEIQLIKFSNSDLRLVSTPFAKDKKRNRLSILYSILFWPFLFKFGKFDVLYVIGLSWLTPVYKKLFLKKNGILIWNPAGNPKDIDAVFEELAEPLLKRGVLDKIILESELHISLAKKKAYHDHIAIIPLLFNSIEIEKVSKSSSPFFRMAFLGRIDGNKGAIRLLKIFDQIKKDNYTLKYYGTGVDEKDLDTLIGQLGLRNQVSIHKGWTNMEELTRIQQEIDLVILLSNSEGVPLTLMECLNYGTPFFATDVGAIKTLEVPNETKVVENNNDVILAELPKFIDRLLTQGSDRDKLFSYFEQYYKKEVLVEKFQKVFRNQR